MARYCLSCHTYSMIQKNNAHSIISSLTDYVDSNNRIPSVQTIDELMVEKCQPGDVIMFDRRCECCASGASVALGCLLGKAILCKKEDGLRSVEKESYEHCGQFLSLIL